MKTPNYQESKIYNSKHFHALFSLESYKILVKKAKEQNMNMTQFVENLILSQEEQYFEKKQEKNIVGLEKLINLINFNKKFYTDLNATFSNLNQIALRLNIANLVSEEALQALRDDESVHAATQQNLIEATQMLEQVRELIKALIKQLEKSKKDFV